MDGGIVYVDDLVLNDIVKHFPKGTIVENEHRRIWGIIKYGNTVIEHRNMYIIEMLNAIKKCGGLVKEVPGFVHQTMIIPITKEELKKTLSGGG
jgi:predicted metallopeptidase